MDFHHPNKFPETENGVVMEMVFNTGKYLTYLEKCVWNFPFCFKAFSLVQIKSSFLASSTSALADVS